jgi:MFS transporter, ACS family, tartrate transporter
LVGWLKDKLGSYAGGLYAVAGMMALSAVVVVLLGRQTAHRASAVENNPGS